MMYLFPQNPEIDMCCCCKRLSALYMPSSFQHIPWRQRSRRQKVIIATFLALILFVMLNVVGWVAYLCVYRHDEKYSVSQDGHQRLAYLSNSSSRCSSNTVSIDLSTGQCKDQVQQQKENKKDKEEEGIR